MKRLHFFLLLLFTASFLSAQAQLQRLALLPSAMQMGEEGLSSLCIDLFRDAPAGETYGEMGSSNFSKDYKVERYDHVKIPGTETSSETKFLGTTDEGVPTYYKHFINAKVDEYLQKYGRLNADQLADLQDEIWAYNGMDHLGYVNRGAMDQMGQYDQARKQFSFRYFGDEHAEPYRIKSKAVELHEIKLDYEQPALSNFSYSENEISYDVDGVQKTIDVEYNGVTYEQLSAHSGLVDKGIKNYNDSYYALPELATFSQYGNHSEQYLLAFEDESNDYHMYFVMANGRLTVIPDLNSEYCYLNKK
jgi:hypothetical protein